jgi:fatty acid desaturase
MSLSVAALAYSLTAYAIGLSLLVLGPWIAFVPAALVLTHAKIVAAYLHHELAHGSVFESSELNTWFGRVVDLLVGAHFWTFEELVRCPRVRSTVSRLT